MLTEQQVRLAARMYEIRDTSRRLLGDKYQETMAHYRLYIAQEIKRAGGGALEATKRLLEALQQDHNTGVIQMHLTAACVEMCEHEKPGASARERLVKRRAGVEARHGT
jgi:hypothetical protein